MLIEIASPVFKCRDDENIFYSRLNRVTHYHKVTSKELTLYLNLAENLTEREIEELHKICIMWNTTYKILTR